MSSRRNLERHLATLGEIREILNSMRSLAWMETRKVGRFLEAQETVVRDVEHVATDLVHSWPDIVPRIPATRRVLVLVGSERGLCGSFNHQLRRHADEALAPQAEGETSLILVGRKLHPLFEDDSRVAARIDGASVVEEIGVPLARLVTELTALQERHGVITVQCFHQGESGINTRQLLPPFEHLRGPPVKFAHPPVVNQTPRELLVTLAEHYLFAALHEILYRSLMAENRHRVSHLDGAIRHLDDRIAGQTRRYKDLRREEIIEEIEVILLSKASLATERGQAQLAGGFAD